MSELLRRIADKVYERASASGELVATDLPAIFREFPEFTAEHQLAGLQQPARHDQRGDACAAATSRWSTATLAGAGLRAEAGGGRWRQR